MLKIREISQIVSLKDTKFLCYKRTLPRMKTQMRAREKAGEKQSWFSFVLRSALANFEVSLLL